MRTARQGTLDGLCGVYAIVNALYLVGVDPPRGSRLYRDLFKEITHGLGAVALLAAMQDGIHVDDLAGATTLAFGWLHAAHGYQLEVSQPLRDRRLRSIRSFLTNLRAYLREPETAVIISYERGWYAHWTVVREVASTELRLRDASGLGALQLADFDLGGRCTFRMPDTLLVRRVG